MIEDQNSNTQIYPDFKPISNISDNKKYELKKVEKPDVLGDIMKADWSIEGDDNAVGI